MRNSKFLYLFLTVIFVLGIVAGCSQSETPESNNVSEKQFPEKPVEIIVPFSAGDGTDLAARAYANFAEKELGQPFVVNNRPGGGGSVGLAEAAQKSADGYHMVLGSTGALTLKPFTEDVHYSYEDFDPVGQITEIPVLIAVKKDSEIDTLKDFVELAKENPGKITYSTPGPGVLQHIIMVDLAKKNDIEIAHVPANGAPAAVANVLGGHVDAAVVSPAAVANQDVKIIAVSTAERAPAFPDVPTFVEQGYDIVSSLSFGFFVPAGTPEDVINVLSDSLKKASEDPTVIEAWDKLGYPPAYMNPEDYDKMMTNVANTNQEMLKEIGLAK